MNMNAVVQIILVTAAVVAAVKILWNPVRNAAEVIRQFLQFLEDWRGEPPRPGFDGRPGIPERLARVEREVTTNSGSSLKDAVRRIEQCLTERGP